tara:strand:- start:168 stop:926 length:759 start_codon:yes stop_codon:yes gene_type:complete
MYRPRIIPVLLLKGQGLYKSVKFKNYNYIGDPINAVKLFNDLKADELTFLDINATKEKRTISLDLIKDIGEEANMPFSVGGGIESIKDIEQIIKAGAEKVVINTHAIKKPYFIKEASNYFGSSTICVCVDVKKNMFGKQKIYSNTGTRISSNNILDFCKLMEQNGAGELIIQSVDKDGTMEGYDINLLASVSKNLTIPVIGLGGAKSINNLKETYDQCNLNGLAAGSLFVYQGTKKGVLINYPEKNEVNFMS